MTSPIQHLLRAHPRDIGGFAVRRVLPSVPKQMVGPFIFFDHMGPARLAPGEGLDVRPHPHIGLATVTYLFEGEILHRDSLGSVQPIRPGDVNWMTAGRGIAHSERTPPELRAAGPGVHGIQTWVALPRESEEVAPSFSHHPQASLPVVEPPGATVRVIAGRAFGVRSPVAVFTDTLYAAAELDPGASVVLTPEHEERGVYVVEGDVTIGDAAVGTGQLAVLAEGVEVEVRAPFSATLMLLGGARMDGSRFIWWNFVSSSKERIERAKDDWREDRFGRVPGETERIPLPER
jgi:redox-sensitive bicupin YhaK (pirin superfamily)